MSDKHSSGLLGKVMEAEVKGLNEKIAQTSACNSSGLNEFDEWEGKTVLDDNQTSACCSSGRYDGNGCKRGGSGERIAQTSDKRSPEIGRAHV